MKNYHQTKHLVTALILVIMFLSIISCNKEETITEFGQSEITLEKTKEIFNTTINKKAFSELKNEPLWESATTYFVNNKQYIEIPFTDVTKFDLVMSTSVSVDKLLAYIAPDGKPTVNVVHYFAQDIQTHLPNFDKMLYFNLTNFNGFATLYDLNKNVLNSNKYSKGVKSDYEYFVKTTKGKDNLLLSRMPENCETVTETKILRSCWFWHFHESNRNEIIFCYDEYEYITYENCDGPEGGSGGGTTVIEEEIEVQILDNELVGKTKCVFEKLKNVSNGYKNMIKKFDGEFPVSHLKLRNSNSLPNNVNAKTYPPSDYIITIDINENNLMRPNLSIARTFIHETIHAEMFRKIMSILDNGGNLNGLTKSQWTQKLANGDYPGIFDYYSRYGVNGMQHQQMAAHYVTTISDYLEEFQPGLSQDVYNSLAWEGLKNTEAWFELKSDTIAIKNTILNFNGLGSENCN